MAEAKYKGIAVLVGLNTRDPALFPTTTLKPDKPNKPLPGCEEGVDELETILKGRGFTDITPLRGSQATTTAITSALENAVANAKKGDLIVFYFAGHGYSVPGAGGDEPHDQALCCFNADLRDDALGNIWYKIKDFGIRILALTDTCHSGTNIFKTSNKSPIFNLKEERLNALMIHIAACSDTQLSYGTPTGDSSSRRFFTSALNQVWNSGNFTGTYIDFHSQIRDAVNDLVATPPIYPPERLPAGTDPRQTVQWHTYGPIHQVLDYKTWMTAYTNQNPPFKMDPPTEILRRTIPGYGTVPVSIPSVFHQPIESETIINSETVITNIKENEVKIQPS